MSKAGLDNWKDAPERKDDPDVGFGSPFHVALENVLAKSQMYDFCSDEHNEIELEKAVQELKALHKAALRGRDGTP